PIADSLRFFLCTFEGPPSTPYADGLFHFVLCVADTYPFRPPVCRAVTRIYHPNINAQGEICISLFQVGEHTDWATWGQLNTSTVGIASILDDPGLNDPLVPEIAELYIRDRQEYEKNVKRYTELYA
ncbi:ubiquitin-conjugating enzyme/RWD-like protein, partial [Lophiotrema nucula]